MVMLAASATNGGTSYRKSFDKAISVPEPLGKSHSNEGRIDLLLLEQHILIDTKIVQMFVSIIKLVTKWKSRPRVWLNTSINYKWRRASWNAH
jgi:hypothetical protein